MDMNARHVSTTFIVEPDDSMPDGSKR